MGRCARRRRFATATYWLITSAIRCSCTCTLPLSSSPRASVKFIPPREGGPHATDRRENGTASSRSPHPIVTFDGAPERAGGLAGSYGTGLTVGLGETPPTGADDDAVGVGVGLAPGEAAAPP